MSRHESSPSDQPILSNYPDEAIPLEGMRLDIHMSHSASVFSVSVCRLLWLDIDGICCIKDFV